MFKDKQFLAWRRKSISLKKQEIKKNKLKKQNFLLKMQKKRAFRKIKNFFIDCKKKDKEKKDKEKKNKEKKINRKKDNLFYKINTRFLKQDIPMPYSIERWIYKDE